MPHPVIESLLPGAGIEGGEVIIQCKDFIFANHEEAGVLFGQTRVRPISASSTRVVAAVPTAAVQDEAQEPRAGGQIEGQLQIMLAGGALQSNAVPFVLGKKIAENLHPVANPAMDRDTGAIYTTLSGTRGQKIPVSVYKITKEGDSEPFLNDIVNPTGIAFSPDGEMFVTSRYDGSVYRVTPFKDAEVFARNLGVATGIAFDAQGRMFVGDRNGTIYLLNDIGEATTFATMEPSIAAYHLGFGPDGFLYATSPNMSSFDSIMRISGEGEVTRFFTGLGRPQGFVFDRAGNMYVCASRRGHRGIVRITPDAEAEVVVAGNNLVGLCFDDEGGIVAVTGREVFRIPTDIEGYWPF